LAVYPASQCRYYLKYEDQIVVPCISNDYYVVHIGSSKRSLISQQIAYPGLEKSRVVIDPEGHANKFIFAHMTNNACLGYILFRHQNIIVEDWGLRMCQGSA